ncbi:unnamed protein product [Brassica oleracea]
MLNERNISSSGKNSGLLDPILVNMLMGHDQLNGPRRVKTHNEHSSSKRRLRRSGERGTIAEIAERL